MENQKATTIWAVKTEGGYEHYQQFSEIAWSLLGAGKEGYTRVSGKPSELSDENVKAVADKQAELQNNLKNQAEQDQAYIEYKAQQIAESQVSNAEAKSEAMEAKMKAMEEQLAAMAELLKANPLAGVAGAVVDYTDLSKGTQIPMADTLAMAELRAAKDASGVELVVPDGGNAPDGGTAHLDGPAGAEATTSGGATRGRRPRQNAESK